MSLLADVNLWYVCLFTVCVWCSAIPEVNHTYNVVGNINEWGVVITETTFGGRGDLAGQGTVRYPSGSRGGGAPHRM